MTRALPRELEDFSGFPGEEGGPLESGTRRAVPASTGSEPVEAAEKEPESQRPTFRVPSAPGLMGYADTAARIDRSPNDVPPGEGTLAQMAAAMIDPPRLLEASTPLESSTCE